MSAAGAAARAAGLAALGALQTLAFVWTAAWPLPIATAAVLAAAVAAAPTGRAALFGWAYSCGWLLAGVWWLFISMHRYGELPAPLAAAAVLVLAAALALYLGLALALYARWRCGRALPDALLFAALWVLAEQARTWLFTGFPWLASGYAQVDGPLAALAPLLGVAGVGAAAAFSAALAAAAWRQRATPAGALAALAGAAVLPLAGALGGVPAFTRPAGELQVSLLQGNVAQDQKFALEHMPDALAWLGQALQHARGELVIAPETAVPLLPPQLDELAPGYWAALRAHFEQPGRALLLGMPLGDFEQGYTNSVIGLSAATAGGAPYRYDKVHLVPFGEFIPTGFRWFTELMNIPLGDFARGPLNPPSFAVGAQRIAPTICYEDLFGDELALRFADAARAPTILANLSNIGWFGDTIALPQHLNISRMRALEFQRPMLRATNTGVTAIIDYRGRVDAQLPGFTQGVLDGRVQGRDGVTPYAWWSARWRAWPWVALAVAAIAGARLCARRRGRRPTAAS